MACFAHAVNCVERFALADLLKQLNVVAFSEVFGLTVGDNSFPNDVERVVVDLCGDKEREVLFYKSESEPFRVEMEPSRTWSDLRDCQTVSYTHLTLPTKRIV